MHLSFSPTRLYILEFRIHPSSQKINAILLKKKKIKTTYIE
jgi:hypothetical protein